MHDERTANRFWAKVDKCRPDECWEWTGALGGGGYGVFRLNNERSGVSAHRVAYEMLVGPIPDGLQIDHLCRVRHCVNPAHMEPVTPRENTMRSPIAPAAVNARKTHCPSGHDLAVHGRVNSQGGRYCHPCSTANHRVNKRRREGITPDRYRMP